MTDRITSPELIAIVQSARTCGDALGMLPVRMLKTERVAALKAWRSLGKYIAKHGRSNETDYARIFIESVRDGSADYIRMYGGKV